MTLALTPLEHDSYGVNWLRERYNEIRYWHSDADLIDAMQWAINRIDQQGEIYIHRFRGMAVAKVYLVICGNCRNELRLETPRTVPCHLTVVCPHCETVRYTDVLEEDIPEELFHDGAS